MGIGESGKSTIFKQFKIVQSNGGFNEEEKKAFISVVHYQCTSQIRTLIENAEKLGEEMGEKGKKAVAMMNDLYPSDQVVVNKELADLIEVIWNDEGIRKTYEARGKKFLLNDCADYFFNNIQRFAENNYIPNEADILRARTRSVGIESAQFRFQNMRIRVIDVGGQRSERRKWISCFDDVTAIIFVVSLSCYDLVLREDENKNAMEETIQLFEEITKHRDLQKPNIILFLNKTDLFDTKCVESSIKVCKHFSDYDGDDEPVATKEFIKDRFLEIGEQIGKKVVTHFTCALNTDNVQNVAKNIRKYLLGNNLEEVGL
uniref:Uncharacterized protein n=1 Tax=Arcella intermedia TaxID=1963864 RepID=A0A6B2L974_9EUKA